MKSVILFLFISFSVLSVYSSDVKFLSINEIYGISIRETRAIFRDDNGFVWTSSKSGVLRVAENNYRIYQLPYTSADILSVNIALSKSTLLAYASNGQIFRYNEFRDEFELYTDLRKIMKVDYLFLNQICIDEGGGFWIATSLGLFNYKNGTLNKITKLRANIRRLALNNNDLYYVSNYEILRLNTNTLKSEFLSEIKDTDKSSISKIYFDKKAGRLWIGTIASGLFYLDLNHNVLSKIAIKSFPKQPILAMVENSDSTLMIGVDGQGIWEINKSATRVLNVYKENVDNPYSINGDGVYDLFCDPDKRIWVSTYSGGLSFFDQKPSIVTQIKHKINNPNSLGNNTVNKVIQDKRGNIWFATNNGISRWRIDNNSWDRYYQDTHSQAKVFLTLCEDDNGNIWGGTYSSGIYVLDGNTGREINHFSDAIKDLGFTVKFVFEIFKDSKGDIWFGGNQGGILCYLTKEQRFVTYKASFDIKKITEGSKGNMIICSSYGLVQLNQSTGQFENLLTKYIAQDVLVKADKMWIATSGAGLLCLDYTTREIKSFSNIDGLPSNYVNSMIGVDDMIWLGTENGLCLFNPSTEKVIPLHSDYSLTNLSFNNAGVARLKNGNLIWASSNGAIMFDPNISASQIKKGKIFIQDIMLSGQSIRNISEIKLKESLNNLKEITLKYYQNTLSLELLSLGVESAGAKYSWKLEGVDSKWSTPVNRPIINYSNLRGGNFILRIKMEDNSLSSVIDERSLSIRIVPPVWDSWWFKLLSVLLLLSIMYFFIRLYVNRLKQRHTEDKIRFFANTAHDIRTSITLIGAPVEEIKKEKSLSEKGRYYLTLASEQIERLSFVTTQLLDFQKVDAGKGQLFLTMVDVVKLVRQRAAMFEPTASKNNIRIEFYSNTDTYITAVDELKLEKVVDNLISNAIKYSFANGLIEIKLLCSDSTWTLEVQDFGLGISDYSKSKLFREFYRGDNTINSKIVGSGIGLLLVKKYVNMHQGEIRLVSKEKQGACFKVIFPYHKVIETSITHNDVESQVSESVMNSDQNSQSGEEAVDSSLIVKKVHLLLVEDNNDLQNFLKTAFDNEYHVSTASNGVEAWEAIQKKIPDLIISDVMMPGMDGFELCKLVKSAFETSHIPFILLTALSDKVDQLEGLGLGADDYITKPFDMALLTQRIKTIVHNREIIRDRVGKLFRQTDNEEPILTNHRNDEFLKKALKVVSDNISNSEFGKDEFASAMNVSASLLYKKIKSLTDQSPVDFIKTMRMDYSYQLLISRNYSVTEVSELSGFSSVGYFSTVFKKHFGKPPTDILSIK